jgi:uncharacterized protein (DUF2267 family)
MYNPLICTLSTDFFQDPYQGMATFQIVIEVGQRQMRPKVPSNISSSLAKLITDCWNEDPADRPSFPEIVHGLEKMSSV